MPAGWSARLSVPPARCTRLAGAAPSPMVGPARGVVGLLAQRGEVLQVSRGLHSIRDRDKTAGYRQGVCTGCRHPVILHPVTVEVRARQLAAPGWALLPLVCEVCLPAAPTRPPPREETR